MATKKYPVGTKIKYIGSCSECKNKTGEIVAITDNQNYCYIILSQSTCSAFRNGRSQQCPWNDIIPISVKGRQLLFDFAQ